MTKKNKESDKSNYLDILAAGLVHEIKNPLNAISVNLQLINEDLQTNTSNVGQNMFNRVQLLQKEVFRLQDILSDFLRFAKKHELDLEKCNINEIIENVLDFVTPEALQNSIRILKNYDSHLPTCYLDCNVMKQALLNVILNAQQAMSEGGELTVRTFKNRKYICIDISDTGYGIPPDKIDKIFQVYYSTKKTGTGLGLPTAKRIIEDHNGTISVHSEVGIGSRFLIQIPFNPGTKNKKK